MKLFKGNWRFWRRTEPGASKDVGDDAQQAGQPLLGNEHATRRGVWTISVTAFVVAAIIATTVSLVLLLRKPEYHTRYYYIAADIVTWNYAPTGMNQCNGKAFANSEIPFTANPPAGTGTVYKKVIYRGYTDATFTVRHRFES